MEERFIASFIHCFFIAFGVIIGGSIIGSVGSFITADAPLTSVNRIAKGLRIWAIVAAIGGTFDAIANIYKFVIDGSTFDIFKYKLLLIKSIDIFISCKFLLILCMYEAFYS